LAILQFVSDCLNESGFPSVRGCAAKAIGTLLTMNLNEEQSKYYRILLEQLTEILKVTSVKTRKQQHLLVSKSANAMATICNYKAKEKRTSIKKLFVYNAQTNANDMIANTIECKEEIVYKYEYPKTEPRKLLSALIDDELLIRIIELLCANSKQKKHNISHNCIRAIGNISYWIDLVQFGKVWPQMTNAIVYVFENDTKLKNQWNACFAAGNAMTNSKITLLRDKEAKISTLNMYHSLIALLDQCENYKVRITAVYALNCPDTRKQYGPMYYKIIGQVTAALNNIDAMKEIHDGFAKQKYRQLLKFRLVMLLSHLIKLFYNDAEVNKDQKKLKKIVALIKLKDEDLKKYCLPHLFV